MMQDSYRKRRNYSHYFRTGCDYYLNERTVWGVSLGGNFSRQRENAGMFTEIRETGVAGNTYSHAEQNRNNVSAGTSMVHKLKREGCRNIYPTAPFPVLRPRSQGSAGLL